MPSIDSRHGFLAVAAAGTLLVASTLAAAHSYASMASSSPHSPSWASSPGS